MLKIWGRTNSLNVQKALMALEEAGVAYERFEAGLAFGVVNTPEYRQMNPNGLVPTIDDDGFILWESNSIIRYVCARYAPALWPADPQGARQRRAVDGLAAHHLARSRQRPLPATHQEDVGPPSESLEKARSACARNFAVLDEVLSRQPFMTGETFGIADCSIAPVAHRWLNLPVERPAAPHLDAWFARVRARPSARVLELPLS